MKELSPYKKREPNRGKLGAQRISPEVGERLGCLSSQMRWKQWVWQKGLQLEMEANLCEGCGVATMGAPALQVNREMV